jgi:regulator of sirC expression with transglutaminase-like and TPR domain
MSDERDSLHRKIQHYQRLRWQFDDERLVNELDRLIEDAQQRLEEIERRS